MWKGYYKTIEGEIELKSFNILILLVLISSLLPYGVDASQGSGQGNGLKVERIQEDAGYYLQKENKVESEYDGFGNWGEVSVQEVKDRIPQLPLNEAVKVGDKVVVSTDRGDIIAYPHTLGSSGWVNVDYKSKSFSGPVEISFGFNGVDQVQMVKGESYESYQHTLYNSVPTVKTQSYTPVKVVSVDTKLDISKVVSVDVGDKSLNRSCATVVVEDVDAENKLSQKTMTIAYDSTDGKSFEYQYMGTEQVPYYQSYPDWKPSTQLRVENKSLLGANKWNTIPQSSIVKDTWYSARFWVEIPFTGTQKLEGKYNIAVKPLGADLSQAVILDPWYGTGWLYRKTLYCYGSPTAAQADYQKKLTVYKGVGTDIPERLAEYTTGDNGGDSTYGVIWDGQTFIAEASANVTKVRLKLRKVGAPTSSYACAIRATNATGYPTGADLCSANITSTYVSTTASWYEFDMGVGTALTSGTTYAWIFYGSSASITDYLTPRHHLTSPLYTGGSLVYSANAGSTWTAYSNHDNLFQIITTPKIYCGGSCQDDFDDIRFTKSDATTLLDYWIESYTSGVSADVWVELDTVVQTTTVNQYSTYYMYYGNVLATSVSSGANTFIVFDDFERGANLDPVGGSWTIANTVQISTAYAHSGSRSGKWVGAVAATPTGYLSVVHSNNIAFMYKWLKTDTGTVVASQGDGVKFSQVGFDTTERLWYYDTGYRYVATGLSALNWYDMANYNYDWTNYKYRFSQNGTEYGTDVDMFISVSYNNQFVIVGGAVVGGDAYLDDVIVRNYVNPEPLWGTPSASVSGIPIVNTLVSTGSGNTWIQVAGNATSPYGATFTSYGFDYGPTAALGSNISTTVATSGGSFSVALSGLTPSSVYYYRAWAITSSGIGYGSNLTASTLGATVLYENHLYGCNTTWSSVYETDSTSITTNWTSGLITSYAAQPVFGNNWTAQTFTTTSAHSVHQVVLWANRSATAGEGYIYVSIREATTDNVTTPDLGIGLYAIQYVSINGGPIEVSLENEIQLDYNKKYAIVVRAPASSSTIPDYVSIWGSTATIYTGGNAIRSISGGASWVTQTYDVFFSIIGRPQPIYGNVQAGQSFTVGASAHTAYKIRLILGRVGQPGNVYVSLRSYTGGSVANADLALVALNGNAITLDKASYDCVLVPEKSLEANKQYVIVVTAPSGDRYNYILMCADSGAGYASGTALISINSGISWSTVASDYNFEVWGNPCLTIVNARVFKNYLETSDWLVCAEILNVYPPYYDNNDDVSSLFMLSFMGITGTTYAATPCELWDKSPVVIYMNPTQAASLSWGGNYKVRIGNLAGTIYSEYSLQSSDWNAISLTSLDSWVRLAAKDMENYQTARKGTTVTYLTYVANKGYVLNQEGGAIFNQACPKLSYVRPNIFQVTSNRPEVDNTVIPTPGATTATTYRTRLGSYLSGLIDQGSAAAGIADPKTFGGLIMVAIYFIIAFGTVMTGFAWAGIIAAFPVILIAMYYGLLDVQMIVVILVILVFLFVREFWWKGG